MKALIIYHANCLDGFTAAWIAEAAVSQTMDTELRAASYGDELPYDLLDTDTQVYVLDFSYKPEQLKELANLSHSVVLLDHHADALKNLEHFQHPKVTLILDMERSGAGLAWSFFNGSKPLPDMVARVQDRDLWRFSYLDTKAVCEAMYAREFELEAWDEMAKMDMEALEAEGEILLAKKLKDIKEACQYSRIMAIGWHSFPAVNLPMQYASEAGHLLATKYSTAGIGAVYQDILKSDGKVVRKFSLRSNGLAVNEIANLYGGGGHTKAAGFEVPLTQLNAMGEPLTEERAADIIWDDPLEETQQLLKRAQDLIQEILDKDDEEEL